MVSKKLPYDTNGLPYDVYMGDSRPQCHQFIIRSSYIEDTYQSNINPKSTIGTKQNTLDDIITPRISKINLQILEQSDSGANCNLTNDIDLLVNIHTTPDTILGTCNKNDVSNIVSTKAGYILLRDDTGNIVRTKVYYAKESDDTVLSPTTMTKHNKDKFEGWIQSTNNDTKAGKLVLTGRSGQPNLTFRTFGSNDL